MLTDPLDTGPKNTDPLKVPPAPQTPEYARLAQEISIACSSGDSCRIAQLCKNLSESLSTGYPGPEAKRYLLQALTEVVRGCQGGASDSEALTFTMRLVSLLGIEPLPADYSYTQSWSALQEALINYALSTHLSITEVLNHESEDSELAERCFATLEAIRSTLPMTVKARNAPHLLELANYIGSGLETAASLCDPIKGEMPWCPTQLTVVNALCLLAAEFSSPCLSTSLMTLMRTCTVQSGREHLYFPGAEEPEEEYDDDPFSFHDDELACPDPQVSDIDDIADCGEIPIVADYDLGSDSDPLDLRDDFAFDSITATASYALVSCQRGYELVEIWEHILSKQGQEDLDWVTALVGLATVAADRADVHVRGVLEDMQNSIACSIVSQDCLSDLSLSCNHPMLGMNILLELLAGCEEYGQYLEKIVSRLPRQDKLNLAAITRVVIQRDDAGFDSTRDDARRKEPLLTQIRRIFLGEQT
jgi:hypothetical protein